MRTMRTRLRAGAFAAGLLGAVLGSGSPAMAACHVIAFVETAIDVDEGASATLQVELQGRQPSCGGTVDYRTVDGSATAGSDYEATSGTLIFQEGSSQDRVQQVVVPILADDAPEGNETFEVVLENAEGSFGISGSRGRATVTVVDDEPAPEPTDAPTTPEAQETPDDTPASTSPPDDDPTDETPTETQAEPEPTGEATSAATGAGGGDETVDAPDDGAGSESVLLEDVSSEDDGGNTGLVIVGILVMLGALGVVVHRNRGAA